MKRNEEQETAKKRIRQMTICNKSHARERGQYVYFPVISLSGKWLKEHGFKPGHVIDIVCEDRRIVITVAKEQRFEGL